MNGLGAAMVNAMVKGVTVTIEGEVGWNGKNIQQQRTQQAMLWRVVMMVRPPLHCTGAEVDNIISISTIFVYR